jgi:sulfide:quinone oxidoreductase
MPTKILIVGSGTGGTFAANFLSSRIKNQIKKGDAQIDLFGETNEHIFQPSYIDIALRGQNPKDIVREESSLLKKEVNFHQKSVVRIIPSQRKIITSDEEYHNYDYLIISTGTKIDPESIPGLAESSLNFHTSPEKSQEIWQALQKFKGGRIVIAVAGLPHKCPASPNEVSLILDDYLIKKGIKNHSKIIFATPYPRVYPAKGVSEVVEPIYEERGIEVAPFFNVESVDPKKKEIYSLEGDALDFDLLLTVPPHKGADVIRMSGLGDNDGWIPTDKYTLTMKDFDDVYVIGDATNLPISKTGVVAHLEAKTVVENIVSDLKNLDYQYSFNGRINCPFETGGGKGTFVIATYKSPPKPIKPTRLNYLMKKGFSKIYWGSLSGRWEPIFNLYFGETSTKVKRAKPLSELQEIKARIEKDAQTD